jgi:hypothetical protein
MSWRFPILLGACILMCGSAMAEPPRDDLDRALIELHKNSPLPELNNVIGKTAGIEMQGTPNPRPWLALADTCYCEQGGREATAAIDVLLSEYGEYSVNEFALAGAWYGQAVGCARDLLDQRRLGEAVSFAGREMTRARAYRGEVNLGLAATAIEAHMRRLLIDANLLGCD